MHRVPTWALITGTLVLFATEVIGMLWLLVEHAHF
jgi:hypothetical protein